MKNLKLTQISIINGGFKCFCDKIEIGIFDILQAAGMNTAMGNYKDLASTLSKAKIADACHKACLVRDAKYWHVTFIDD